MLKKLKNKVVFAIMFFLIVIAILVLSKSIRTGYSAEVVNDDSIEIRHNAVKLKKEEIINNLDEEGKAKVLNVVYGEKEPINITFTGMVDRESMKSILFLLDEHEKKANFSIQGIKAAENGSLINEIREQGHVVGSYGLLGLEPIDEMTHDELIEEFAYTNVIFDEAMGEDPSYLMTKVDKYNDDILKIAKASGYETIVQGKKFINDKSFNSYEEVLNYIKSLEGGSMLTFKLDEPIDDMELTLSRPDNNSNNDKSDKDDLELTKPKEEVELPQSERLLRMVEWVIRAVDQVNYSLPWDEYIPEYEEAREQNEGKLAAVGNEIYTTTKGIAFTFSKIGDDETLDETLKTLSKLDAKATFFVTGSEVIAYKEQIAKIKNEGHEIASSGFSGEDLSYKSFNEICEEIHKGEVVLKKQGISTKLFMPPYGRSSKEIQEAVSAMGYTMVTYTSSPVRSEYQDMNAKEIVEQYYQSYIALRRGNIVNIKLDYYSDAKKVGQIIEETYKNKIQNIGYYKQGDTNNDSGYKMMTVGELLKNTYTYPIPKESLGEPKIYLGQLNSKNKLEQIKKSYIGSPHSQSTESLIGFNYDEIAQLNNQGIIDTKGENTIFITFDDWGSDAAINQLLYVLDKHDVPATFFIRSNFVSYNPNLLRAIAEDGHDISSHTLTHYLVDINYSQVAKLQEELILSYEELEKAIGDLDELKIFFRPPTLAVSKIGVETVLDAGYSHVINGDFSTKDYEAKSLEELKDKLDNGILVNQKIHKIQPGSIVVMHMSDESMFTAETLDVFFTENAQKSDDDPTKYKFAKLSDYLK